MIDRGAIWMAALKDLGSRCSVDTNLDIAYVEKRIASEGESFLTISLPKFGKDLELALEDFSIARTMFAGFTRRQRAISSAGALSKMGGGIPSFLQGFLQIVFDDSYDVTQDELTQLWGIAAGHNEGLLSHEENHFARESGYIHPSDLMPPLAIPCSGKTEEEIQAMADAIAAIRQLCLMFGKEKSLCSSDLIDAAVDEFVLTDEELMLPFTTEE